MRVLAPAVLFLFIDITVGLDCFSCQHVRDPTLCRSNITCLASQSCYQQSRSTPSGIVYDMGCRDAQVCAARLTGNLVGRSAEKRQDMICHQCCSTTFCNTQLCLKLRSNSSSSGNDDELLIMDNSSNQVIFMDIRTQNFKAISLSPTSVNTSIQHFDYDPVYRDIYWADNDEHKLVRTSVDSLSTTELLRLSYTSVVTAMAIDPVSRLLFVGSDGTDTIDVVSLPTLKRSTIIATDINYPTDIELDIRQRKLYWSDRYYSKIEVTDYDGKKRKTVLAGLSNVYGLALDTNNNFIYWADANTQRIEKVNIDGSQRQNVTKINGTNFVSLEVDRNMLYYTDSNAKSVMAVPVSGGAPHLFGKDGIGSLIDIKKSKDIASTSGLSNGCANNNGGCDHICVPVPDTTIIRSCLCTDGYNLSSNGVTCVGFPMMVRLAGSGITYQGRVEVSIDNGATWGTVCDNYFDSKEASVVCQSLGLSSVNSTATLNAFFGAGVSTQGQLIYGINCGGHESTFAECGHEAFGKLNCGHSEDAGVICTREGPVRLVNSNSADQGRVEVFINNEWGTICDDGFDWVEAGVICGMLGYSRNGAVAVSFGSGSNSQPIHLDNLDCDGNEETILECRHNVIDRTDCYHKEDVGVVCQSALHAQVRLVGNGSTELEGRVEISRDHGMSWSTVCDDYFGNNEARVVCRMLGFRSDVAGYWTSSYYGPGSAYSSILNYDCAGDETSLLNCKPKAASCSHSEDAGVVCNTREVLRLVGGSSPYEGRVEISLDGGVTWGTICNDLFDPADAAVVCSFLGYQRVGAVPKADGFFGPGQLTQEILLDDLDCRGSEESLMDCTHPAVGYSNCNHSEDVGVICLQ
ncbi:deleted in malignant brain tumors 1 protein-like [Dreissena polymorpha]|uniref:deleted in malignant brain tumors 1 protein-like n=1 Tax=Dreissena polymorpha TaxID=45954 RepID=UPI0022655ACF|nr:deleted in malignant brain tumors 1 protein-like [Dreissena polymorpha]